MLVAKALLSIVHAPFRSSAYPPTIRRHVMYTAIRAFTSDFTPVQHLKNAPSSDAAYESYCKANNVTPDSEILVDGTRAHWLGPRTAKQVIIHFHGGGYVVPAPDYCYKYLHSLREQLGKETAEAETPSILVLSYDLAPTAKFPRQLVQAVSLLQHALVRLRIPPSNIILSGDSAGGNLVLAVLSHLVHPRSDVPHLELPAGEKLRGAVLISPWASFDYSHPSFAKNAHKDDITKAFVTQCSQSFLGTAYPHPRDPQNEFYTQPGHAPASWWEGIPVEGVLVTGGADEILIDGVRMLGQRLVEALGKDRVEVLVAKEEAHEHPLLATMMGESGEPESTGRIRGWVRAKL
jgi:acetyl esterase/lipase